MTSARPQTRSCGSSPRMRGTGQPAFGGLSHDRFIPAHAGNRCRCPPPRECPPVHPRACGEQGANTTSAPTPNGSSPRMRGTVAIWDRDLGQIRFIPAHAGNRRTATSTWSSRAVHPRACGEQVVNGIKARLDAGSSPRMRGTARDAIRSRSGFRFIPAHAGNRRDPPCRSFPRPVHPRACGEQASPGRSCRGPIGSSPRMRGTGAAGIAGIDQMRFIPAHAGNR